MCSVLENSGLQITLCVRLLFSTTVEVVRKEAIKTAELLSVFNKPARGYPGRVARQTNYRSGNDYVVEFLDYRFSFGSSDFEERVIAAAVRLEFVAGNDLSEDETADLVELVASPIGQISEPRSDLGRYLIENWEKISLVNGESLVYWLRKLVFRGAWLDHRVKQGLLEVAWDEDQAEFGYRDRGGDRTLLELAPVPSWRSLRYRT